MSYETFSKALDKADVVSKAMRQEVLAGNLKPEHIKRDLVDTLVRTAKSGGEGIPLYQTPFSNNAYFLERLQAAIDGEMPQMAKIGTAKNWVTKDVLSTAGATQVATIRTDLVPHIWNLFVQDFPLVEKCQRVPANGLSHTFNVRSALAGAATFTDDLVAATAGASTYNQLAVLVSIGIGEYGASFRTLMAQQQSGMSYDGKNAVEMEIEAGVMDLKALFQKGAFQGEKQTGSKTGLDEYGTYYQYGFDGLRGVLGKVGSAFDSYYPGSSTNIAVEVGTNTFQQSFHTVAQKLADAGQMLDGIEAWMDYTSYANIAAEAGNLIRVDSRDASGFTYGANPTRLNMGGVAVPINLVPGTAIGSYTPASGAYSSAGCRDIYFFNPRDVAFAHLGPSTPFVVEIPMGVDGALGKRFLIAWLASFVDYAPPLQAKLRSVK